MKKLLFTFLFALGTFVFSQEIIRFSAYCYKVIDEGKEIVQAPESENISRFVLAPDYLKLDDLWIEILHSELRTVDGTEYLVIIGESNGDRMPVDIVVDLIHLSLYVSFPEADFKLLFNILS